MMRVPHGSMVQSAIISALTLLSPALACAFVLDFEEFLPGEILAPGNLGHGVTLSVVNNNPAHPDAAIVFDSNCGQQNLPPCTGGDSDLRTPGPGPGNTRAQRNIMIIAENLTDEPQCPPQSQCVDGIESLVMVYHGLESNVTVRVSTKKQPGSGDLGIFQGLEPGDAYEVTSSAIGKDRLGPDILFEIKTAAGAPIESSRLHTSCSQPIWSGMPVGEHQQLACFDSLGVAGDDSCTLGTAGEVICQDGSSPTPADGLVDGPDDEAAGGTITFTFSTPVKCSSLRAIDIETTEAGDRLELSLVAGGTQVVPFALLGDNSAQTVTVANPASIDEMKIILVGSGGIDDITCAPACGDGVLDAGEQCDDGNTMNGDCCSADCVADSPGSACDDGDPCTAADQCNANGECAGTASTCGDGQLDAACGEQCDDGNETSGDCCSSTCQFEASGSSCADDGNPCTDDFCDAAGSCTHPANTDPCDDGDVCSTGDVCSGGACQGGPPFNCDDGNVCTDDFCNPQTGCAHTNNSAPCDNQNPSDDPDMCVEGTCAGTGGCQGNDANCDDGNPCTDDTCLPSGACAHANNTGPCEDGNLCTVGDSCSGGICTSGSARNCDDGNVCTNDTCDPGSGCINTPNSNPCDDGDACTAADTCQGGVCLGGAAVECDDGNVCTDDACDPGSGCVYTNNTAPCDDQDPCSATDQCNGAGSCVGGGSVCGNGVLDPMCGEECDDGNTVPGDGCDPDCTVPAVCGDGVLAGAEECDDGNTQNGDGCSDSCTLEDTTCFPGTDATVSKAAKFIVFTSRFDFLGTNPDGNDEVFILNRKEFNKQSAKKPPEEALAASIRQVTFTTDPVTHEWPTLNGSGRFVAFVSTASLCAGGEAFGSECSEDSDCPGSTCTQNPEGNKEVFHADLKRRILTQITQEQTAESLHPNLRAFKGNLLAFDSDGNIVPDRCSGGSRDRNPCITDAECPGGACGNPEGNREVYLWIRSAAGERALRQLTTAAVGDSKIGRSLNFDTRATAFSSTANLLGGNGDLSQEIFRIRRTPQSLLTVTDQVTTSPEPEVVSESPAQSKGRIVAFVSDGDLIPGENPDRNPEIFVWRETTSGGLTYTQITHTAGCNNAFPSISARGEFVAFQSTCNLIPSKGNPGQSVFIYDVKRSGFLRQLVLRGPNGTDSSKPTVSRKVRVVTFEADTGAENVVCVFNARKEVFEGPVIQ